MQGGERGALGALPATIRISSLFNIGRQPKPERDFPLLLPPPPFLSFCFFPFPFQGCTVKEVQSFLPTPSYPAHSLPPPSINSLLVACSPFLNPQLYCRSCRKDRVRREQGLLSVSIYILPPMLLLFPTLCLISFPLWVIPPPRLECAVSRFIGILKKKILLLI